MNNNCINYITFFKLNLLLKLNMLKMETFDEILMVMENNNFDSFHTTDTKYIKIAFVSYSYNKL